VEELRVIQVGGMAGVGDDDQAAVWLGFGPQRHGLADVAGTVILARHQQKRFFNDIPGRVVQAFRRDQLMFNSLFLYAGFRWFL
jgi:hypothetical protein